MAHPAKLNPTDATRTDSVEVMLGRTHWTHADYVAEGYRVFDAGTLPQQPGPQYRDDFARDFARISMPPAKLAAHRKTRADALAAEFGAPPALGISFREARS